MVFKKGRQLFWAELKNPGSLWLLGVVLCGFVCGVRSSEEVICGGFDMRNDPNELWVLGGAELLKNCTVVEGDVRMVMLTRDNLTSSHFHPFPTIREITGFLLVFQVYGLDSLGRIFPNLRTIRGNNLLLNYALTVYQNPNLKEIGLHNLAEISNGGVRITENKELCSADLTNWEGLCKENELRHIVVRNNKNPNQCDFDCDDVQDAEKYCWKRENDKKPKEPKFYCWNGTVCQKSVCFKRLDKKEEKEVPCNGGCFWNRGKRECCHDECVGGCEGPTSRDCFACRSVFYGEECLPKCPEGMFLVKKRRCVSEQQCRERTPEMVSQGEFRYYKPIDGVCDIRCPPDHEEDPNDGKKCVRCHGKCSKHCVGGMIASLDDAKDLEGCNIVQTLQIRVQSDVQGNVSAILSKYMKDIVEVKGFVAVSFSEALVSLDMLKSVRKIGGESLYTEKYALSVFENPNLVQLFNKDQKLEVLRGELQFHNNQLLCYKEITKFAASINVTLKKEDASARSNGNKAICEDETIPLKLNAKDNEGFVLSWEEFNISFLGIDDRRFLGYQVYYKEVEEGEKPDMFTDRDACHDSWNMIFEGPERGVLVNQLKSNTNYAFYVKTLIVHHDDVRGGISDIHVYKTDFGAPSPPRLKKIETTPDSIFLEWLPPLEPNGEITHYKIEWVGEREDITTTRDYCVNRPEYNDKDSDSHFVQEPEVKNPDGGKSMFGKPRPGHCKEEGCCECDSLSRSPNSTTVEVPNDALQKQMQEQIEFENAMHNFVFQKNKNAKRAARIHLNRMRLKKKLGEGLRERRSAGEEHRDFGDFFKRKKREVSSKTRGVNSVEEKLLPELKNTTAEPTDSDDKYYKFHTENETKTEFRIKGLKHYTLYQIKIWACQNLSVESNYCSRQEVQKLKRTEPILENDAIPGGLTVADFHNSTGDFHRLTWKPPKDPNGKVLLYELIFKETSSNSEMSQCVTEARFDASRQEYIISMSPGNWSVTLRAFTLAGSGPWTEPRYILVKRDIGIPKWVVIVLCVTIPIVVLLLAAVVGRYLHKRNLQKHTTEYIMNIISTCPDYISTLDVYKPDQWELQRDDIELLGEIGEGTFGKVYAGRGKKITSYCGVEFGDCAVKTVRVSAGHWDRLSFLMEASIMKQFVAAFIVKLYGVVSDGQPAFVVMEMMHKGNLRDYLRSRRPDEETNTEDLPPPTLYETLLWAGQVADGMAYLESIKFCHRDLAARNCLVTHDNSCKIGDFGMTRDLYVKDYYRPTGKRLMPVRWMAPESLKDARFTSKSDVWSYGVVIWEMATLAQQPYAGLGNEDVFSFVVDSRKVMDKPTGCPDTLYRIMDECWKYDPRDRTTFAQLVNSLLPDMDERFKKISFSCNREDSARPSSSSRVKNGMRSPSAGSESKPDSGGKGPPNGVIPIPTGSLGTDASDLADSDTPLNPAGVEEYRKDELSINLQSQDSDGEELQTPVCSSNRRGNMPKSYSTPNWARKSGGGTTNSPRIEAGRTVSNGPMANGHIPPVSV